MLRMAADPWETRSILAAVRRRSLWMEVLGVALIALGIFAWIAVFAASLATVFLIGGLLLVEGVAYMAASTAYWRARSGGLVVGLLLGCLSCIAGILCFIRPLQSLAVLTFVMGIYFVASGIARFAIPMGRHLPGRGWGIAVSIVDVVLGIVILASWPVSSVVVPGTLLGIQLFVSGIAAIATGSAVRGLTAPEASGPTAGRPATRFQH
jgi:uncharacterized membrane protein HdeD (DUF308 family)